MLTRKDFIEMANRLITSEKNKEFAEGELQELIEMFCIKFKKSYPRFSEIRFRDWIERGLYDN